MITRHPSSPPLLLVAICTLVISVALAGCPEPVEPAHVVQSEYHYLAEMRMHHLEAVESAREIREITQRDEMRQLASRIIAQQEAEIAQIERWLELYYPERQMEVPYEPMMRPLEGLSPEQADQAFLEDMIVHHQHAIDMSRDLLQPEIASRPEIEDMAREIIETQEEEIQTMRSWLREWYGVEPPDRD